MPFIQAWVDGQQLQWKEYPLSEWEDVIWFNFPDFDKLVEGVNTRLTPIRIKPEPSYRKWKPEEVPVGARIKGCNNNEHVNTIIISFEDGYIHGRNIGEARWTPHTAMTSLMHSTDFGKTWQPCGVLIV